MKKYYKKRAKVGNKSYNKSLDIEIARLESQRKPLIYRNGEVVDKSPEITAEIEELKALRYSKRTQLSLNATSNRINSAYFSTPCVYRLWEGSTLVYVGQTNNLARRISQHQEDKVFDAFDVYSHIENETVRLNVERQLIEQHKPKYNIQHKSKIL